ncbi:hypothetical protein B0H13DRAFT_668305 [Mycena leptocephala]|nr:hypothetical protein B0H13DRAFT_668305 [Mycena leptocephala]
MDDSPPPAYSKEYKRQVVDSLNITPLPSHNPNGTETPSASKRADGRGPFPRPLPRLPAGESPSVKTGTVAPLRLHKKSQSTAIPSIARPWKPSTVDGAPLNSPRWDPVVQNPPSFVTAKLNSPNPSRRTRSILGHQLPRCRCMWSMAEVLATSGRPP